MKLDDPKTNVNKINKNKLFKKMQSKNSGFLH